MAMNRVSDITLAKAVTLAGGIPSLSVFNYKNDFTLLKQDILEYKNTFGNAKLLLSIGIDELLNQEIFNMIIDYNIEFIELIPDNEDEHPNKETKATRKNLAIKLLADKNIKVFLKCLSDYEIVDNLAGVILKGVEGAGRGFYKTDRLFDYIKTKYPYLHIIVSGGIGSAEQVKYYMDKGALAIGIGTLFAAAKECKIVTESKMKMVESTSDNLTRFSSGANQYALIFKEMKQDHYNHTHGLEAAIKSSSEGHIFAGNGINYVTEIKSVEDIIKSLIANLHP